MSEFLFWLLRVGPARRPEMPCVRVGPTRPVMIVLWEVAGRGGALRARVNREMDQRDTGPATVLGTGEEGCLAPGRLRSLNSPPSGSSRGCFSLPSQLHPRLYTLPPALSLQQPEAWRQSPGGLGTLVESYCGYSPAFRVDKTRLRQSFQPLLWKIKWSQWFTWKSWFPFCSFLSLKS